MDEIRKSPFTLDIFSYGQEVKKQNNHNNNSNSTTPLQFENYLSDIFRYQFVSAYHTLIVYSRHN
jgi:hypothetical protein